mgnify:CR=1 FL=1
MTAGPCSGHWGHEDELDMVMPAPLGISPEVGLEWVPLVGKALVLTVNIISSA